MSTPHGQHERTANGSLELQGFSGAGVYLLSDDGRRWYVRKIAKNVDHNARLRTQAAKQIAFAKLNDCAILTPQVLNEGELDGLYYFDMEFVRGLDGVNFLRRAKYANIKHFSDRLVEYVQQIAKQKPLQLSGNQSMFAALYQKLCDVQSLTNAISGKTLSRLFLMLNQLQQLEPLPETCCHGDFTLQNLVVNDRGEIWTFDLLNAPYEHYWQDIAKLHQDFSGSWFQIRNQSISQCALDYVGQRILTAATQVNPAYALVHPLLVASTFVRILPYVQSDSQRDFVLSRLDYFANDASTHCS